MGRLRTYLRHPGLLDGTYPKEDGDEVGLEDEHKEELGGIHSYMNYLQNQWGPDIDGMFDWHRVIASYIVSFIFLSQLRYLL